MNLRSGESAAVPVRTNSYLTQTRTGGPKAMIHRRMVSFSIASVTGASLLPALILGLVLSMPARGDDDDPKEECFGNRS